MVRKFEDYLPGFPNNMNDTRNDQGFVRAQTLSQSKVSGCCEVCHKPATHCCRLCFEGVDEDGVRDETWYCSKDCEKSDRPNHKSTCTGRKMRKQLYRAGKFIQSMYYMYRKNVFDIEIKKIEKHGKDLTVYEGDYGRTQVMATYPAALVSDQDVENALLSYLSCNDVLAHMHYLVSLVLEGILAPILGICFPMVSANQSRQLYQARGSQSQGQESQTSNHLHPGGWTTG